MLEFLFVSLNIYSMLPNAIKIHSQRSDEEEQIFILLTKENAKHIFLLLSKGTT